jgi:hypothetical protein
MRLSQNNAGTYQGLSRVPLNNKNTAISASSRQIPGYTKYLKPFL